MTQGDSGRRARRPGRLSAAPAWSACAPQKVAGRRLPSRPVARGGEHSVERDISKRRVPRRLPCRPAGDGCPGRRWRGAQQPGAAPVPHGRSCRRSGVGPGRSLARLRPPRASRGRPPLTLRSSHPTAPGKPTWHGDEPLQLFRQQQAFIAAPTVGVCRPCIDGKANQGRPSGMVWDDGPVRARIIALTSP